MSCINRENPSKNKKYVLKCGTARRKKKSSSQLLDMPPNSHLKTRLQYNCYLSGSLGFTTGKQLCTDVIRPGENSKKNIYSTHFLFAQTGNQHTTSLFCFPGDVSVELTSNLTPPFFFLEKCILVLQPCISVLAYPLGFNFFFFLLNI